ncbi:hypothetical protein Tco_1544259, partial [Tanacetum coccineum]
FNVIGQVLELPKLFNDLFMSHEGLQKGTKSTMPLIEEKVVDLSLLVASPQCCLSKGEVMLAEW